MACSDRRFLFIIAKTNAIATIEAAFAFAPLLKKRKDCIRAFPMKTFRYGDGDRGEVIAFVPQLVN